MPTPKQLRIKVEKISRLCGSYASLRPYDGKVTSLLVKETCSEKTMQCIVLEDVFIENRIKVLKSKKRTDKRTKD